MDDRTRAGPASLCPHGLRNTVFDTVMSLSVSVCVMQQELIHPPKFNINEASGMLGDRIPMPVDSYQRRNDSPQRFLKSVRARCLHDRTEHDKSQREQLCAQQARCVEYIWYLY